VRKPVRLRAVLLDAVGTLIRTREPIGETYARLARNHGADVPASRLEEAFGRLLRSAPPMVFRGVPPERIPGLERGWWRDLVRDTFRAADGMARFDDFDAFFNALYSHFSGTNAWSLVPGAREALAGLQRDARHVGILSNFDHRLPGLLKGFDLLPWLACIVVPANAGAAKPDPRIFVVALRRLAVTPERTVYVGDDPEQDVAAAREAGLHAIDVASLANLAELPDRIARLEKEGP
jgi:putative hydrolase of the HAD superfamily